VHFESIFSISNFYHRATTPCGAGPLQFRGFMITLRHTTLRRTPLDESSARPKTSTWQHTTEIHDPCGIRTRKSSKQAATEPQLRPRSHWDRQCVHLMHQIHAHTVYNIRVTSVRHVSAGKFHHQEIHSKLKPFTVKWIIYMYCQYILLLIPVGTWIKYVDFLPSVTPHVKLGRRPQWFEDHSKCLYICCRKASGSSKIIFYLYIFFIWVWKLVADIEGGKESEGVWEQGVENKLLSRIFGPRRDDEKRNWRRMHNEALNDLYCSPNIVRVIKSRRMRWAGHVACMVEVRVLYGDFWGNPDGKRPLGRPRRRWMKILGLTSMGWVVDWIGLAQDRDRWRKVVSVLMTFRVPWNAGNFLTSFKNVSCTGKTLHHGVSI